MGDSLIYLDFYRLKEPPFSLTPDTQFFLAYGQFNSALNTLLIALKSGEGFIKVTGEIGCGKTLLCRKLLNEIDGEFYSAYIPNPALTPVSLVQAVAEELDIDISEKSTVHQLIKAITGRLIELNGQDSGKQVVLCIDEAQSMPTETLEAMRLLTNLETEKRKLLQVVLFGQPELDEMLNLPEIRQLKQRITFSYKLTPLDRAGLKTYIHHRLKKAGSQGGFHFTSGAMRLLFTGSRGYPRLINILAHKSLMLGYGEGSDKITSKHLRAAIRDTEGAFPVRIWNHLLL